MAVPYATLDEALREPGGMLAWSIDFDGDQRVLSAFSAADRRQLAYQEFLASSQPAVTRDFVSRGFLVGHYGFAGVQGTILWWTTATTFEARGETGTLSATADQLSIDGNPIKRASLAVVVGKVATDRVWRGVSVRLFADAKIVTIIEATQVRASVDATYDDFDTLDDAKWVVYLGKALATWLALLFENETPF